MKYLKKFEESKENGRYDVGDYVLLDLEKMKDNNDKLRLEIKDINNLDFDDDLPISPLGRVMEYEPAFDYPYQVKVFPTKNQYNDIKHDEIIRHLTPEEIKEYKMLFTAEKYNL